MPLDQYIIRRLLDALLATDEEEQEFIGRVMYDNYGNGVPNPNDPEFGFTYN